MRASYQFECSASVRGCNWQITRREVRENSAIFRSYNELFPGKEGTRRPADRDRSPHLFTVFLDPNKSVKASKSVSFLFDLKVLVPDYEVDGSIFMKRHFEGGYIYRQQIVVEAFPDANAPGGWRMKYGFQDINPGKPGVTADTDALRDAAQKTVGLTFDIPIEQKSKPGLSGKLRIEVRSWT